MEKREYWSQGNWGLISEIEKEIAGLKKCLRMNIEGKEMGGGDCQSAGNSKIRMADNKLLRMGRKQREQREAGGGERECKIREWRGGIKKGKRK